MGQKVRAMAKSLFNYTAAAVPEVFAQSKLLLTCVYTLQPKFRLRIVLIKLHPEISHH